MVSAKRAAWGGGGRGEAFREGNEQKGQGGAAETGMGVGSEGEQNGAVQEDPETSTVR